MQNRQDSWERVVHRYKTPEFKGGLQDAGQVTMQTWAEGARQEESVGSHSQCYSGWGCQLPAVYVDTMNSMPKTRELQRTTKTQNMRVEGRITHNISFFYMAGPAGLQNPSLLWAGKATRGVF